MRAHNFADMIIMSQTYSRCSILESHLSFHASSASYVFTAASGSCVCASNSSSPLAFLNASHIMRSSSPSVSLSLSSI